jgi:hypothetical protein
LGCSLQFCELGLCINVQLDSLFFLFFCFSVKIELGTAILEDHKKKGKNVGLNANLIIMDALRLS